MEGLRRRSRSERVQQPVVLFAVILGKRPQLMDARLQPVFATRRDQPHAAGRRRCRFLPHACDDGDRDTARPVPGPSGRRSPRCASPVGKTLTKAVIRYRNRKVVSPGRGSQSRWNRPAAVLSRAAAWHRILHPALRFEPIRDRDAAKRGPRRTEAVRTIVREGTERASSRLNWRDAGPSPDPLAGQGSCSNFRTPLRKMSSAWAPAA
jgi:hypothetical protein